MGFAVSFNPLIALPYPTDVFQGILEFPRSRSVDAARPDYAW